jgi:hypothetical protein
MEWPSVRLALASRPLPRGVIVPVPSSFQSRRFSQESSRAPREVVLAVGGRAIVRDHHGGLGRVSAMDDDGTTLLTMLGEGVEVEITAWRPRRSAGALYRVRQTAGDALEGWVTVDSLEPIPLPTERRTAPMARTSSKPAQVKTARRTPVPVR